MAGDSPGVGSDLDKTGAEYAQAAGVSPWLCGAGQQIVRQKIVRVCLPGRQSVSR